ncbi:sigma-70 family RNA polymerase sigma factor [Neglecta sp. X4]|uniref:sigma-70 family RNA polymerase sigma factor n=1 Tax=unclassified Neglectibacter TaxID=2632164 RepID=UPI001379B2CA|nr:MULTISPECIES: sigma-70 family RNA polymerase sigma factor [unclassified Neglectibacter]NBI18062.1 sigma-70 family RNA polymerase sigma factor [Neglectibacter sp. 59]NBJ73739.1 sigma-70 family RNA polymerase sigma factor [Neglectibacter sp. X4]NCE81431.1 sigma-70 family RNA polymerase sigma factor [Neglectibacter sp. X58]
MELDTQFADTALGIPDDVIDKAETLRKLSSALATLTDEEIVLIQELFYLERTEREISHSLHIALSTLHDRKKRILKKLRTTLEKNF